MSKMKNCKSCNAEIAASAKTCPHCGAKNKKPIFLRPWFIALILIVVVAVFAGGGSDEPAPAGGDTTEPKTEEQVIEYKTYDVGTLVDDLEANAMKASETYLDQYVELSGQLSVIDSSGSYFSIERTGGEFELYSVTCYFQNDEQKQIIMDAAIGDVLTVKGQITDVGEIMGYNLDVEEITR